MGPLTAASRVGAQAPGLGASLVAAHGHLERGLGGLRRMSAASP